MKIFTIGYEATTMDAFLASLTAAGVEQVIDVRALPLSRRPGFSKNVLAATLKDNGIGYIHLKALGTPKPGRDAAKKGDWRTMEKIYEGSSICPRRRPRRRSCATSPPNGHPPCCASNAIPGIATGRCCCVRKAKGSRWLTCCPDTELPAQPATGSFTIPSSSRSIGP